MVSLALPQNRLLHWLRAGGVEKITRIINILLIIWLAWLVAHLSWNLVPAPDIDDAPAPKLRPGPVVAPVSGVDGQKIANLHLFGEADKAQPVKKVVPEHAPETRLKLTLRGVFATGEGDDAANARAIVGDPRGKEESYSVGDPLPGGAKLSEIYADRIILERNGRFETLRLPKEKSLGTASAANRSSRAGAGGTVDRAQAFSRYRKEIKSNPAAFLEYVRATPARVNGKFVGFRLQAGRKQGAMDELGLNAGDIVTGINGVKIDSPAQGMKAMQSLGQGDTVNVTLLRGGEETTMNLTLPASQQ